ncbi:putative Dihydroorotate dehydrogenase [Cercophora samala]|uniref:Dihydroorotate dehydrogenase (fumarate) n=1 Tax=Cercophora samala TaxID=330535 RepID=A0AA39ZIN6_9PEZI|nr:putative Dihydroorotate dehydrogenase [Cercophora samala]
MRGAALIFKLSIQPRRIEGNNFQQHSTDRTASTSAMPELPPPININPPLINSANPWASDYEDLERLYLCPSTGAVTTRTATLDGFKHDDAIHRYAFFDPSCHQISESTNPTHQEASRAPSQTASLNTLGYSPHALIHYLKWIEKLQATYSNSHPAKPFIISVTGTPGDIMSCYSCIAEVLPEMVSAGQVYMEINLSCPNIPNKPPPAYSKVALVEYLKGLRIWMNDPNQSDLPRLPFGIKTPPYTHSSEYHELMSALEEQGDQVSFITCTNTLGSCLVLSSEGNPVLPGNGIGGMAGAALHPLALGNVATIRRMLDERPSLKHITVVGIGGVEDDKGYKRMRAAGAGVIGVGTALGVKGVRVFKEIEEGLKGEW